LLCLDEQIRVFSRSRWPAVGRAVALSGCSGAGGGGSSDRSRSRVDGQQSADGDQKLTADNFTKQNRHQGELHRAAGERRPRQDRQEFSSQAGQYDVATISNYEVPFYAKNGWLYPLDDFVKGDSGSTSPTSCPR